jgi:hypothetical protein
MAKRETADRRGRDNILTLLGLAHLHSNFEGDLDKARDRARSLRQALQEGARGLGSHPSLDEDSHESLA